MLSEGTPTTSVGTAERAHSMFLAFIVAICQLSAAFANSNDINNIDNDDDNINISKSNKSNCQLLIQQHT